MSWFADISVWVEKPEVIQVFGDNGEEQDYVPERTCRREKHGTKMDGSPKLRCSLCGYGVGDKRWNYCPNCGAKVVDK